MKRLSSWYFGTAREALAVSVMDDMAVPAFVLDEQGRVAVWNRACERLTGVKAGEVLGGRAHWRAFYDEPRACLADLVCENRAEEAAALFATYRDSGGSREALHAEGWCAMPRRGVRAYLAIDAGPVFDARGKLVAVVETLRDMTEQKLAQVHLQNMANQDGLTGLANRRQFDATLAAEWHRAQRVSEPLSLVMIDVDQFKRYNDTYGHLQGDDCLRAIARALKGEVCRPADLAARYGGEEFAAILPWTDLNGAFRVAEDIRRTVRSLHLPHGGSDTAACVTLSLGVVSAVPACRPVARGVAGRGGRCALRGQAIRTRSGRGRASARPVTGLIRFVPDSGRQVLAARSSFHARLPSPVLPDKPFRGVSARHHGHLTRRRTRPVNRMTTEWTE